MATRFEEVVGGTKANDILLKDFTTSFRPGYGRVFPRGTGGKLSGKGYLLPTFFSDFEKQIREMEVKSDDVWVASYPKTGTTWTQEMVWCICNDMDLERAKSTLIRLRFPFMDFSFMTNFRGDPNEDVKTPENEFMKNSVAFLSTLESPRFIKTHLPWDLLPEQLKSKKPKIVYIARNPKDSCVSYFHHCRLLEGYKGSFADFVHLFLEDSVSYSPFWDHVYSYWEHRDDSNVLFLTYEEMKKDLPSVIRRVSKFMGKEQLNEEDLKVLCDHLSFKSMKSNNAVNYEHIVKPKRNSADQHFMRKGEVDSWKEEMSPEDIEHFDAWIEKNLSGLDSHAGDSFRKWLATGKL
ncbi:luciferin sulfotransferase-like [Hetaerina americana]|uniref:luciferin sulfotransferase-like n=1 Tax=Hetaerina americana TaxID=62018 RepID=UPI003A7F1903